MILGLLVIVGTAYLGIAAFITVKSYPLFAASGPRPTPVTSGMYAAVFGALWPVSAAIGLGQAGFGFLQDHLGVSRLRKDDDPKPIIPETPKPQEARVPGRTWYERVLDDEDPWV